MRLHGTRELIRSRVGCADDDQTWTRDGLSVAGGERPFVKEVHQRLVDARMHLLDLIDEHETNRVLIGECIENPLIWSHIPRG